MLRARVGRFEAEPPEPAPLVLIHCGERGERRIATGGRLGCEIVHVRVDGEAAIDQAAALVRGAMRFAEEAGDLRGPRRGPLAGLGGAAGHANAPWPALNARLEALLAGANAGPVALVLSERSEPLPADGPRETAQPDVPWLLPLELPRGALDPGIVLRALELGAAAVCAVVPREDAQCAARIEAASALAHAVGEGDRVTLARSFDDAIERLRRPLRPAHPPPEPVAREPAQRPDARAIALSMWRRDTSRTPRRITGPGAPGGAAAVNGDACTLCGLCVAACPTGALTRHRERMVALRFDSSRCPYPCGRCESACPVRALTVSPELCLPPEQVTLVARAGTCASCGELWPEAASVAALGPKLASGEAPALLRFLSSCPNCRSRALGSSLPIAKTAGRE